jgi:hypothetical protein
MKVDNFTPFLAWSQAKGIKTPLELIGEGSYRKMVLPKDKESLMSQSSSNGLVQIIRAPLNACLVGEDWETLVDKLKYEKSIGTDSDFEPWISQFPTLEDFSSMPRFWTHKRCELVNQYDGGQLEARMERDKLRFDQVDDMWAQACVDSRSNYLPDNTYCMTPLLDMLNHDPKVKTTARVDPADRLLLEVTQDTIYLPGGTTKTYNDDSWTNQIFGGFFTGNTNEASFEAGKEVFVSYGDFDNMETLCNYGFVADDNIANVETFKVRVMRKAPAFLVVDETGSIDNLFNTLSLADLRVNLLTENEFELMKEYDGVGEISDRNELEVWAVIAGELDEAAYQAKMGIAEAKDRNDELVAFYLKGRYATLQKGIDWLKKKFPDLF